MGSSSVYCNFSKITITYGDDCVLVPLEKAKSGNGISYTGYHLHCLPIFGKYNDYQGIEDIKPSYTNQMIEKFYDMPIQQFCDLLTEYSRKKDNPTNHLEYCWVHRKVWDEMTTYKPKGYARVGSFDMGNHEILMNLGFEYVGTDETRERYKEVYSFEEDQIYSDGRWLEGGIYNIFDLKEKFPSLDTSYFEGKQSQDLFEILTKQKRAEYLYFLLGITSRYIFWLFDEDFYETYSKRMEDFTEMQKLYVAEIENLEVLKGLADVVTVVQNAYYFSEYFKPNNPLCTPQCGEHAHHQYFLERFVEINKSLIQEDEEE